MEPDKKLLGKIVCADSALLDRMAKRPRTILNPPRMRRKKTIEAAANWLEAPDKYRSKILDFIETDADEGQQETPKPKPVKAAARRIGRKKR